MRLLKRILCVTSALLLASCSSLMKPEFEIEGPVGQSKLQFKAVSFQQLPEIADSEWEPALAAFQRSCVSLSRKPDWKNVCLMAQKMQPTDAKGFFLTQFVPYQITAWTKNEDKSVTASTSGMMTGYYEPLLYGSRTKKKPYTVPLHGTPDDLITVDLGELYPQIKGLRLRGRVEGQRLVPYGSRADLTKQKGLDQWAIAWVEDPVSAFFLQVQGSGRIVLPDGSYMRVGYANTNGHPYKAIGRWLIDKGYLTADQLSMQSIRAWAEQNPKRVAELLNQNPSYIFFTERQAKAFDEGPIGAQGVPLTPLGSIAVDRRYYQLGWPMIVDVKQDNPEMRFTRAVVAQDTGGAIKGPIRFDFFWGFGEQAGELAGRQKSDVKAWVMLPVGMKIPN
jgi:membrane-bound lytic murein transglycosylase A